MESSKEQDLCETEIFRNIKHVLLSLFINSMLPSWIKVLISFKTPKHNLWMLVYIEINMNQDGEVLLLLLHLLM